MMSTRINSLGGMCGAIVTSPFDVVKTRLQSSLFQAKSTSVGLMGSGGSVVVGAPRSSGLLWNFVETGHILRYCTSHNTGSFDV
jgi:solute carrier family 25, member 33/36